MPTSKSDCEKHGTAAGIVDRDADDMYDQNKPCGCIGKMAEKYLYWNAPSGTCLKTTTCDADPFSCVCIGKGMIIVGESIGLQLLKINGTIRLKYYLKFSY